MRLLLLLALGLLIHSAPLAAADKKAPRDASAAMFGLDKVHSLHLTIQSKEWATMQPKNKGGMFGPGFGPGRPPARPEKGKEKEAKSDEKVDRKARGLFGFEFEYVKGDLEINGTLLKEVGVRYKGNSSYASSQGKLKRPLKIDLNRYEDTQSFQGLKKLTLNSNIMDATAAREALSYAVYRALDVPAPRTAYAQLTVTVPGKYDKEFVGLYTLVEPIDKTFLKNRFGSAKGLLLKPERVGPLEYLGEEWSAYEDRYRPKTEGRPKDKKRLIEFVKLVQKGSDEDFKKEIGKYLDVDEFLRFIAGTVALSSMDSFIGLGHNYVLYLDPKTDKFVFLPWDLDHSLGGFVMMGSPDNMMDLSIRQPWTGRNRLLERLFKDDKVFAGYKGHLAKLLEKGFTPDRVKKALAVINSAIDPIKEKEKKAVEARKEGGGRGFGMMFGRGTNLETFVAKRSESIKGQLSGERKGTVLAGFGFGGPGGPGGRGRFGPGMFLAKPILDAADKDKDGKLTREEAIEAAKVLFKSLDKEGKGELDQKSVAEGIDKLLPRPGGFPGPPGPGGPGGPRPGGFGGFPSFGNQFARSILEKAGKDGKVTSEGLVAAVGKLFSEADKNKDGKLDDKELTEALNQLLPLPGPFGPPRDRPGAPKVDPKEGR